MQKVDVEALLYCCAICRSVFDKRDGYIRHARKIHPELGRSKSGEGEDVDACQQTSHVYTRPMHAAIHTYTNIKQDGQAI